MRALRRLLGVGDRFFFPEAASPAEHWQRMTMNDAVRRHIASLNPQRRTAVEISGDAHGEMGWREYSSLNYPAFDLCDPISERRTFDVVICEQVLEHVVDPWGAAANLRDLCAVDGHVIVTTPFLIRVHELPMYAMHDYWRFTPRGLRILLEQSGLKVDTVGSWGNRECVVGNFNRWSKYRRWHSLRNEREFPVQVWAFAKRPR